MGGRVSLAEIGSLQLEFAYLSDITGNPTYREKAEHVFNSLSKMTTTVPGLYPAIIDQHTKTQTYNGTYWLIKINC